MHWIPAVGAAVPGGGAAWGREGLHDRGHHSGAGLPASVARENICIKQMHISFFNNFIIRTMTIVFVVISSMTYIVESGKVAPINWLTRPGGWL